MSGDSGLHDQTVIFYSREMTQTKMTLLSLKGIKFVEDYDGKGRTNTKER